MDKKKYIGWQNAQVSGKRQRASFIAPIVFLSILSVILAVAVGLLLRSTLKDGTGIQFAAEQIDDLETQRDALMIQLDSLEALYNDLVLLNAGNEEELLMLQKEIDSLRGMVLSGSDRGLLRACENRILELNDQLSYFTSQLTDLANEKSVLTDEISQVKAELSQVTSVTLELQEEKEQLLVQLNLASQLNVFNVTIRALRDTRRGDVDTRSARRTDKLQICMSVLENMLVQDGEYDFYFQIFDPDKVLMHNSLKIFASIADESVPVTFVRTISYKGATEVHCADFSHAAGFREGMYLLRIFSDYQQLWDGEFILN